MILLEFANRIVEETFLRQLNAEKKEQMDMTLADFDGVTYHVYTPEGAGKEVLNISMKMSCLADLADYGAGDAINGLYGAFVTDTESGYDVTLSIDTSTIEAGDRAELAKLVALLKRNCLSAPFESCFDQVGKTDVPIIEIKYRPNESIYLQVGKDRVTVIFSIEFTDANDVIFAKVFLQEFKDAKRNVKNCPPVAYTTKEPPAELEGVSGVRVNDNMGFVTIVMFPRNWEGARRDSAISLLQTFRDYLHYHIKCTKAYMHTRMRSRVESLLKVLNRAKVQNKPKEKKTASGKTFTRK
jgi:actin related protein 2/3 complex subunit 2